MAGFCVSKGNGRVVPRSREVRWLASIGLHRCQANASSQLQQPLLCATMMDSFQSFSSLSSDLSVTQHICACLLAAVLVVLVLFIRHDYLCRNESTVEYSVPFIPPQLRQDYAWDLQCLTEAAEDDEVGSSSSFPNWQTDTRYRSKVAIFIQPVPPTAADSATP